jgi:hypothetical protein
VGTINAEDLEPEFRNLKNEYGVEIRQFQFNKGL